MNYMVQITPEYINVWVDMFTLYKFDSKDEANTFIKRLGV